MLTQEELQIASNIIGDVIIGPNNARAAFVRFAATGKTQIRFGFKLGLH
jgi:hypothetical protein